MLKRIIALAVVAVLGWNTAAVANEGMWLPMLIKRLNERDMQKMGLQLTAEELYSVNNSSLKDAIVNFGNFCTAEVISPKGLILTNHHCGYGAIQSHSTEENNILENGFWAYSHEEEIPSPGLSATFLIRMDDVTERVLAAVTPDMTESERSAAVRKVSNEIIEENEEGTHYSVQVKEFFGGNEYYMFVYEIYTDVRLVGTPPEAIGKYGGDTDNWMWPRHTGDFSLFRVYSGPDGKPAEYSEDNIPMVPKHYLPVNVSGVKEGDYTMVFGYPGSTDRYLTSHGIDQALNIKNQKIVDIRDRKLNIMREYMSADPEIRLQYASKFASTANYWKYYIGQTEQLVNNEVMDKKLAIEREFTNWVNANEARAEEYGNTLSLIDEAYKGLNQTEISITYLIEGVLQGSEALANTFGYIQSGMAGAEGEELLAMAENMKAEVPAFFKDYNRNLDRDLLAAMMEMFYHDVPEDQMPRLLADIGKKWDGKWDKWAEKTFKKSMFDTEEELMEFLNDPNTKKLSKDPLYVLMSNIYSNYMINIRPLRSEPGAMLDKGNRLFIRGLREMNSDTKYYPNANFTMRMTYGKVGSYEPRDGVHYDYYTTIEGIMEKEDPTNPEFIVPAKLKELYMAKDYGRWANEDGDLVICFITDNDITGGNSGSPVINGRGELVGTAFDGNWEAMSGDIEFDETLQRTIVTDIRYVLFCIDKMAGAQNLIDEMKLVTTAPVMERQNNGDSNPETVPELAE
jgi:hypothetical protein